VCRRVLFTFTRRQTRSVLEQGLTNSSLDERYVVAIQRDATPQINVLMQLNRVRIRE